MTWRYYLNSSLKKIQSNKIRINKSLKILHATENHDTLWQALLHLCCFKVSYPTKQRNMYEWFRKDRWFIVLVEDWFLSAVFGIWFLQIIKKRDIFPTVIYWTAGFFLIRVLPALNHEVMGKITYLTRIRIFSGNHVNSKRDKWVFDCLCILKCWMPHNHKRNTDF